MRKICLQIALASLFFTGCVSTWSKSDGSLLNRESKFGMQINKPLDWYGIKVPNANYFTRHGLPLDNISITEVKWDDTLFNGYTLPQNILLHEIPEFILADFYILTNVYNLNIVNNQIISLDNLFCTNTLFEYTDNNSLAMQGVLFCIPLKKGITAISFVAEKSIYFERYKKEFETIVKSIDIIDNKYRILSGIPTILK